jgi:signal transduction histidine kinase
VLLEAAERVVPRAHQRGIQLGVEPTDGAWVAGEPSLLTQLLVNLLDNSLRHTAAGGRVTLAATAGGNDVVLRVADTGEGIPAEHLPRLFERFYRVDKARSRGTGGFGLGLAIARWIAEAHHGSISLTSEVGVGTTVEVRLPRAPDAPTVRRTSAPGTESVPSLEGAAAR